MMHQVPPEGFRPAKNLTPELYELCRIYFEEELYAIAFPLLDRLLLAGTSVSTKAFPVSALIPTADLLRIVATAIVHPAFNTKGEQSNRIKASDEAFHYLRNLNAVVGPLNAHLGSAFQFPDCSISMSRQQRLAKRKEVGGSGAATPFKGAGEEQYTAVNTSLGDSACVFNKVEHFWHIVGWGFNCSVRYPARWKRWRLFLEYMLDVLEADLEERARLSKESKQEEGEAASTQILEDCMIMQYLAQPGFTDRTLKRRIMRAIFAAGDQKALNEFPEVFRQETEALVKKEVKRERRKKVNIEEGEYGDYDVLMEDEEEPEMKTDGSRRSKRQAKPSRSKLSDHNLAVDVSNGPLPAGTNAVKAFGGLDAFVLRRRFLVLLTRLSCYLEGYFTPLEDLLDLYCEFIRPLPVRVFALLIYPTTSREADHFLPYVQEQLCQMLLRPLLAATAPDYETKDLTQKKLTDRYLPYAANTHLYVDNAKVSIICESLVRSVLHNKGLEKDKGLGKAILKGREARFAKTTKDERARKQAFKDEESEAQTWLEQSGKNLEMLAEMIESG